MNAYGELTQQTDAKNQVTTLQFDAAGRLSSRTEAEGTTQFTYYPHSAAAGQAGRLQQVTSPGSLSEAYKYHSTNGAVNEITRSIGASSYKIDFAFDTHGRLSRIDYPTNIDAQRLAVEYVFDGWGALSQVRNATTPSLVYYTLNTQAGSGAVRRATFGNGVVEQYGYEATTGRLASIQLGLSGSATLQNLAYDWDLAGNLSQRVDALLSRTETFNYDALDRLTSVVRNSSTILSAGYNALGNITSKTGVTGTYTYGSSRPHAVTGIGSMTFAYDTNGNMTNRNGTTVTWTSYNLPSHIQRPSGEYSTFVYGADRSRYRQIEGAGALSSTRHYAAAGLFEALTWNGGSSRVDYHYIHAHGRAIAQFTASNVETDTLTYLHRDHQGSVVATTNTAGTLVDRFEYDPFGARTTTAGSDARKHRGYTGHEHLKALDLIHMNGRVQDPTLGRFLSPDPIVQAPYASQSLNRYSYVWNNPMSLVDPSGFQSRPGARRSPQGECQDSVGGGYFCGDPCRMDSQGGQCQGNTVFVGQSGNEHTFAPVSYAEFMRRSQQMLDAIRQSREDINRMQQESQAWEARRAAEDAVLELRNAERHAATLEFLGGVAMVADIVTVPSGEGPAARMALRELAEGIRERAAARAGASAFGGLSRAGQYGIRSYSELTKTLKGTGLQAHHLIEQRFAGVLGQNARQGLSVAVTQAEHQAFTNAWRSAIPYGAGTANATEAQIMNAARQIYADYPQILNALGL